MIVAPGSDLTLLGMPYTEILGILNVKSNRIKSRRYMQENYKQSTKENSCTNKI